MSSRRMAGDENPASVSIVLGHMLMQPRHRGTALEGNLGDANSGAQGIVNMCDGDTLFYEFPCKEVCFLA